MPRLVVTAAEVATGLGDGIAATFAALRAGRRAVVPIVGFDAAAFGADAAAPLAPLAPTAAPDGPTRVVTPHGELLAHVARAAHDQARLAGEPREAIALMVALGMVDSPAEDLAPAIAASRDDAGAFDLGRFFAGGFRSIHPHWPLRMLANVVVGQLAADLDVRGDNVVLAAGADAGARVFAEAAAALESGAALMALVAGVGETIGPGALLRAQLRGEPGLVLGEGAGAVVLETAAAADARGASPIGALAGTGFAFEPSGVGPGPSAAAIERAARAALADASRTPADVGVVLVEGTSAEEAEARRALFGRRTDVAVVAPAVALGHLTSGAPAVASALALAMLATGEAPSTAHGAPRALAKGRVALVLASGSAGGAGVLVWEGAR